jgi:DNA-binding CsgD family transcriptional regulator/PAS domain-containing protein
MLSKLIGEIYDCVLEPKGWQPMVAQLQDLVDCVNAVFGVQALPAGRLLLTATSGIDAAHLEQLGNYGPDIIDQWGGSEEIARHSFEEPAVLSWKRPRELWEGNRYYAQWAKPQGIVDVIGMVVARDASAYGSLGFGRHVRAGPVTDAEIDLLRTILPHIQRAVSISRVIDLKTIAAESFKAALDALHPGIVLVDAGLRIIHANTAAQGMLAAGDPIASSGGRLRVPHALGQQALLEAVTLANADESLIGRRGFGIPARTAAAEAVLLHVLPLRYGTLRPALRPSAAAAVFVAAATSTPRPPEQAMAALFDLTPAESRVFAMIGTGKTIAQMTALLGIGRGTVKTHLLRIFAKTGTRRQAELVKLAASLAPFV